MEPTNTLNNEESGIVADICAGGSKRNAALKLLYTHEKVNRSIAQFVLKYGGDDHDIRYVLQESIIIFDRLIREKRFRSESQWETFLIGIGKNTCRNFMRTRKTWTSLDDVERNELNQSAADAADTYFDRKELEGTLSGVLDELKPLCREVLMLWAQSYPMDRIADALNLGRPANARKRKYRCMKELMQLIKTRPQVGHYLHEAWKTIK